jgi:hypothetical protein
MRSWSRVSGSITTVDILTSYVRRYHSSEEYNTPWVAGLVAKRGPKCNIDNAAYFSPRGLITRHRVCELGKFSVHHGNNISMKNEQDLCPWSFDTNSFHGATKRMRPYLCGLFPLLHTVCRQHNSPSSRRQ